jgi:hypothetical protein
MASDQVERVEILGGTYDLLMSPRRRRSAFLYGAVGAADIAILFLFFSPGISGVRLDGGARALLYVTVTSLGLVILATAMSSLALRWYQLLAPYVFIGGALCTAVAVELLLAQLDSGAFWCLLPWLVGTAVVTAVPTLRRAIGIWSDNKAAFARLLGATRESIREFITARRRHLSAR